MKMKGLPGTDKVERQAQSLLSKLGLKVDKKTAGIAIGGAVGAGTYAALALSWWKLVAMQDPIAVNYPVEEGWETGAAALTDRFGGKLTAPEYRLLFHLSILADETRVSEHETILTAWPALSNYLMMAQIFGNVGPMSQAGAMLGGKTVLGNVVI